MAAAKLATSMKQCFYEVLDVPRDADTDAIRKAYKKMALRWHPGATTCANALCRPQHPCAHASQLAALTRLCGPPTLPVAHAHCRQEFWQR